jgi:mandelate racemase
LPEISVHLLAATPTCHYLEYVDWADAILEEPLKITNGCALVPQRHGLGLAWRPVKALDPAASAIDLAIHTAIKSGRQ